MKISKTLGLALGLTLLSGVSGMAKGRKLDKGLLKEVSNSLMTNDGTDTTEDFSKCKYMMYVFGASWKKDTTPFVANVAKFYNDNKGEHKLGAVYVSSDLDETTSNSFVRESSMPWNSLQYSRNDLKGRLQKGLNATKVPSMVIVDRKGKVVLTSSIHAVTNRRTVANVDILEKFSEVLNPQLAVEAQVQPKKKVVGDYDLVKLLGKTVYNKKGSSSHYMPFDHKYNVVYCSAHWCPPCRQFTPQLVKVYNDNLKKNNISLTFVSLDHTKDAMENYMKEAEMPWFSTKFDPSRISNCKSAFQIRGIPALLVFDSAGNLIKSSAQGESRNGILQWLRTVDGK